MSIILVYRARMVSPTMLGFNAEVVFFIATLRKALDMLNLRLQSMVNP